MLIKKHFTAAAALVCVLSGAVCSRFSEAASVNSSATSPSAVGNSTRLPLTITAIKSSATTAPEILSTATNSSATTAPETDSVYSTSPSGNTTMAVRSTASPPTAPSVKDCSVITSMYPKISSQIKNALKQLENEGHARSHCALIRLSDSEDISTIFDQLDDDITILLSSTGEEGIKLLSSITLKSGQHLIGLPPEGANYLQLKAPRSFSGSYMVQVGDKAFKGDKSERKASVIRGIKFAPERDGKRESVDSIISSQCYNGELIVKDNHFILDRRAAVFLDCKQSNKDVSVLESVKLSLDGTEKRNLLRGGPGLLFSNNKVYGLDSKLDDDWRYPNEGVFISMPLVINLPKKYQPLIQDNEFIGIMKDAIELKSGSGASILRNTIKSSSAEALAWGGVLLIGTSSEPLYTLTENVLGTKFWGVKIENNIRLSMAKNQITSNEPFKQNEESSLITVSEESSGNNCDACNTWTSGSESDSVSACKGLYNIRGNIHFENETCSTVIAPDDNSASMVKKSALFIMTLSLVLFNL